MSKETHLKFIEGTISRLADNSAQIKKWGISVETASIAFVLKQYSTCAPQLYVSNNKNWQILLIPFLITLPFCVADVYYLYLERLYRILYKDVVNDSNDIKEYEMDIPKCYRGLKNYFNAAVSFTGFFHLMSICVMTLFIYLMTR